VIAVADDTVLKDFLPKQGDRIAVKEYCKKKSDLASRDLKKRNLLDSLREKLCDQTSAEQKMPKKVIHLSGNSNAKKSTRKIELGWLNFDNNSYKQVKTANGGGTRKIDIPKHAGRDDILKEAKTKFFPNGTSKLGSSEDFEFEIRDFSERVLDSDDTIGDLYEKTGLSILRFYMSTRRVNVALNEEQTNEKQPKRKREASPSELPDIEVPFSNSTSTTSAPSSPLPEYDFLTNYLGDSFPNINVGAEIETSTLPVEVEYLHYKDEDVSFNAAILKGSENTGTETQPSRTHQNDTIEIIPGTSNQAIVEKRDDSVEMIIHRGSTAFYEMIAYFKDPEIERKILTVSRILPNGEKEMAEDTGGVIRDTLSEFWGSFYEMCTSGKEAKVPALRHDLGNTEWCAIGRILIYGYKKTGYWPVKLSKAFILSVISKEELENSILLDDFWKFVSSADKDVLQQAYEDFSSVDTDDLLESLDTYDCRRSPNAENIKSILLEIAHTILIQKPTFVSNCIRADMLHANLDRIKIEGIYEELKPTAKKVISLLHFPNALTTMESDVARHLKRYIKDIDTEKLGLFLRFCTGSNLLTVEKISVEFTSLTGCQRRPVAHTCGCVLELPRTYESFIDFRYEFDSILSHNIWIMDIV
jgi:hypothetical protein